MRNNSQRSGDVGAVVPRPGRVNNGIIPNSFRTLSGYLRIVSSGASTVASTVRSAASAASAIVERDAEANHDQVSWAGFDKLELEGGITRQVLLLAFSYGFQIWDVEVADNVRNLVTRHDGPVSFMQMLPKPVISGYLGDKFAESRPLLIISANGAFSGANNIQEGSGIPCNGFIQQNHGSIDERHMPTIVCFYSLRTQAYVHLLRFRSAVLVVRCSSRMVAVLQSTQIHCLNAATLEREYTILTNPVPAGCYASGDIGFGPLAVGPRWMAYSGSQVRVSDSGCVVPQHLTPSPSFPCPALNGSLVAHYAKESSKHLAAGIVTLGDIGYKKLSRYYSERLPESKNCVTGNACVKIQGIPNGHTVDADSVGMVIVRDIVSKTLIAQFRAHKSPVLSLCFDPSGVLLVTASVQGHNINVFRIMPGLSGDSGHASGPSYVHLYKLQRGLTNAVIRDISFSSDSRWIMISSSRGTSHLFAISPSGGLVSIQSNDAFSYARNSVPSSTTEPSVHLSPNLGLQVLMQQSICASSPLVTLSAVSRIRNGCDGWKSTVTGAAATATGRLTSISASIASVFHYCNPNDMRSDANSMNKNYQLLVFSQSGSVVQYALRISPADNGMTTLPAVSANVKLNLSYNGGVTLEAIQKWNICQKLNCRERGANIDIYGEIGSIDNHKVHPERMKCQNDALPNILSATCSTEKITAEERLQMYISEVELQMHQNQNPLWARSKIYFHSVLLDGINTAYDSCGGEIEIEKVPVQMVEARAKGLVPVFDYLQTPKCQFRRTSDINGNNNGQVKDCNIANRSSSVSASVSGSVDNIGDVGILDDECNNGLSVEKGETAPHLATETRMAFVNSNVTHTRKTGSETTVDIRENFAKAENRLSCVHKNDSRVA